jgi:gamma-glutamylaminecyclotransferase
MENLSRQNPLHCKGFDPSKCRSGSGAIVTGATRMHSLFIYGTLKRGFPNHDAEMGGARYVGLYQTTEAFPLVIAGAYYSPCLIDESGQGYQVSGELFEVDDKNLQSLDRLESTHLPNGYRRVMMAIKDISSDRVLDAWVYVKDRKAIADIHNELREEYRFDPRYVVPSKRSSSSDCFGGST